MICQGLQLIFTAGEESVAREGKVRAARQPTTCGLFPFRAFTRLDTANPTMETIQRISIIQPRTKIHPGQTFEKTRQLQVSRVRRAWKKNGDHTPCFIVNALFQRRAHFFVFPWTDRVRPDEYSD